MTRYDISLPDDSIVIDERDDILLDEKPVAHVRGGQTIYTSDPLDTWRQIIPDEAFKIRNTYGKSGHKSPDRAGGGTVSEWRWLVGIASHVKPATMISTRQLAILASELYGDTWNVTSRRIRRCWRRGWVRMYQVTNKDGKIFGFRGRLLPKIIVFKEISDEHFGLPRVRCGKSNSGQDKCVRVG